MPLAMINMPLALNRPAHPALHLLLRLQIHALDTIPKRRLHLLEALPCRLGEEEIHHRHHDTRIDNKDEIVLPADLLKRLRRRAQEDNTRDEQTGDTDREAFRALGRREDLAGVDVGGGVDADAVAGDVEEEEEDGRGGHVRRLRALEDADGDALADERDDRPAEAEHEQARAPDAIDDERVEDIAQRADGDPAGLDEELHLGVVAEAFVEEGSVVCGRRVRTGVDWVRGQGILLLMTCVAVA